MSPATFIAVAIVIAGFVVILAVAVALAHTEPPASGGEAVASVPLKLLCPVTGDVTRVEVGFDPLARRLALVRCERFPTGAVECDRACVAA